MTSMSLILAIMIPALLFAHTVTGRIMRRAPSTQTDRVNQRTRSALDNLRLYRLYFRNHGDSIPDNEKPLPLKHGSPCKVPESRSIQSNALKDEEPTLEFQGFEPDDCMKTSISDLNNPNYSEALECDPEKKVCVCLLRLPYVDTESISDTGKCMSAEHQLCSDNQDCLGDGILVCSERIRPRAQLFSGRHYDYAEEETANEDKFCTRNFFNKILAPEAAEPEQEPLKRGRGRNAVPADTGADEDKNADFDEDKSNDNKNEPTAEGQVDDAAVIGSDAGNDTEADPQAIRSGVGKGNKEGEAQESTEADSASGSAFLAGKFLLILTSQFLMAILF